ncbi:MAG: hypothetical protein IJ584_06045 [Bacteroidales bacterium]|nr:hypothetical protein [Bacteroidales bacterium]
MKRLHFVTICICLLLAGCAPRIITEHVTQYVTRDSLIVRDTTVYVKLPPEVKEVVVYPKDTSELETSLAESTAYVDSLGLHHSLRNKDRDWGVTIPKVTRIIAKAKESAQIRTITKEVDRRPTWWEKVRLWAFTPLVLLCLVGWRKELIKFYKAIAHFLL